MVWAGTLARQLYPRAEISTSLRLLLPVGTLGEGHLLPRLLSRHLCRDHLIRLPDQLLQLFPRHRIQPVQHHPLVAPYIRRGMNILVLDQLGKNLRRALEAKPRIVQADDRENLPADLEAEA